MMKLLLIACFLVCIDAQLEDVDIIKSEMPSNMEKFAIGQTIAALSMETDFKLVAKDVIDQMNARFGKEWVTLVGTGLHTLVIGMDIQNNTFLLFSYKQTHVLLFKMDLGTTNQNQFNQHDAIVKARSATADIIGKSNTTTANQMISFAKQVLAKDFKNCQTNTHSKDIKEWCYRDISLAFVDIINKDDKYRGNYTVTVGQSNYCSSESLGLDFKEVYYFLLDSIYFQITEW